MSKTPEKETVQKKNTQSQSQSAQTTTKKKNPETDLAAKRQAAIERKRRLKKKRTARRAMDVTAAVLLLGGFGAAVGYPLIAGTDKIEPMSNQETLGVVQTTDSEGNTAPPTEPPTEAVYDNVTLENNEIYKGDLLLVNGDYPFMSAADAKISTLYERKTESYSVSGMDISMQESAIEPLNAMLDAFANEMGHYDMLVIDGFRTLEQQQALYDADLALTGMETSTLVAKPGHSEHETGYALDFSLFYTDGTSGEYDGTGDYDWIDQHCADFGYILRYPQNKTEITKIQYESWHYRYVGKPHAYYIMQSGICLEEYIEEVKAYSVESPLEIVDGDGAAYAVYYVPADTDADVTYTPILPGLPYTISGNNIDGFIVTIDLQETRELVSYTKPVEEITGIMTDEYGNVIPSATTDITAETTVTTTVAAVG